MATAILDSCWSERRAYQTEGSFVVVRSERMLLGRLLRTSGFGARRVSLKSTDASCDVHRSHDESLLSVPTWDDRRSRVGFGCHSLIIDRSSR